jgi:hypothetical protein
VKEGSIDINSSLMPDQQAAIITKPGEGSLNDPTFAISPEFSSSLHFRPFTVSAMWNYQINFNLISQKMLFSRMWIPCIYQIFVISLKL